MDLGNADVSDQVHLDSIHTSFVPSNTLMEDYDYHLSFDENDFLGMEQRDTKFVGNATI
jgi:hypothetical protein